MRNRSLRVASLKRVNENSEAKEKEKKRKKRRKKRRKGRRGRRRYTLAKVDSMFCLAFNVCGISNSYKSRKVSG